METLDSWIVGGWERRMAVLDTIYLHTRGLVFGVEVVEEGFYVHCWLEEGVWGFVGRWREGWEKGGGDEEICNAC